MKRLTDFSEVVPRARGLLGLCLLPFFAACASAPTHKPIAEEPIPVDTSTPAQQPVIDGGVDPEPVTPPSNDNAPDNAADKTDAPAPDPVATKLDARNGFGTATLGDGPKSYKGLKPLEKKGDRVVLKAGGKNQYAGVSIKDVQYTFMKGKLGKISFTPAATDCKTVHEAFERDFGTAQKHVAMPMAADVWRGNDVGLRFNNSGTTCSGVMIRRELATTEWTGLDQ